ncbi:MAG TPA: M15 family metallopeptidase [Sumerlaeia bacterium]|nr:M15 family metallopeptidase [Sumerlaeia bacterium]
MRIPSLPLPPNRFLCLLGLAVFPSLSLPASAQDWIVLPDKAHPYKSPSMAAPKSDRALAYPRALQEVARIRPTGQDGGETGWLQFAFRGEVLFLPEALVVQRAGDRAGEGGDLPIGGERVGRDHPLPLDYKPSDLVSIAPRWNYHPGRKNRLRAEAAEMAERMLEDARRDGIELRVVSAHRSAWVQRSLYLQKIAKAGLGQKVVAKPGQSEHQLGTALDVCGLDPGTVLRPSFAETPEGRWVKGNGARYGFVLTYTDEAVAARPRRRADDEGYVPEPWHVRYVGARTAEISERSGEGGPSEDCGSRASRVRTGSVNTRKPGSREIRRIE